MLAGAIQPKHCHIGHMVGEALVKSRAYAVPLMVAMAQRRRSR